MRREAGEPQRADHYFTYGVFLEEHMREVQNAERLYMRALDMEPAHTGALVNLANIAAKTRNDTASAQELYTRALACEPHSAGILNNLALMQVGGAASARSPRPSTLVPSPFSCCVKRALHPSRCSSVDLALPLALLLLVAVAAAAVEASPVVAAC